MTDAVRRGLRTAAQVFIVALLGALYAYLQHIDFSKGIPDLNALKAAGTVIIGTALTALVAWLMNHLEDLGLVPAVLKAPASSGADPVPANAGPAVPPGAPPRRPPTVTGSPPPPGS